LRTNEKGQWIDAQLAQLCLNEIITNCRIGESLKDLLIYCLHRFGELKVARTNHSLVGSPYISSNKWYGYISKELSEMRTALETAICQVAGRFSDVFRHTKWKSNMNSKLRPDLRFSTLGEAEFFSTNE
jgi:hypothetical protein